MDSQPCQHMDVSDQLHALADLLRGKDPLAPIKLENE
jgi:hypothetical protein